MPASPASLLADSLSSFSKSALKSLKDLEKQLAQAATDTRDAQEERDHALKQSHASQLQLDAQAQDILKYKSSVIQLELTTESQADVIAQLQREVNHWKEQARNWQDHFTRVEEERCSLSTKLDEVLSSQSLASQFVSTHLISGIETPLSTTAMKRSSGYFSAASKRSNDKSKSAIQSPDSEVDSPVAAPRNHTAAQQTAKATAATKPRKSNVQPKAIPNKSPDPPLSRLVRRVQAVVTVKSEEDDEESASFSGDNERDPTYQPTKAKQVAASRRKSKNIILDDDECLPDGDRDPSSKDHPASDDEEDELMLGGEDPRRAAHAATLQPNVAPPNKRRKLNDSMRRKTSKKS